MVAVLRNRFPLRGACWRGKGVLGCTSIGVGGRIGAKGQWLDVKGSIIRVAALVLVSEATVNRFWRVLMTCPMTVRFSLPLSGPAAKNGRFSRVSILAGTGLLRPRTRRRICGWRGLGRNR